MKTSCLFSCLLYQAAALGVYERSQNLSPSYNLYWTADKSGQTIKIAVVAKTVGWVGLGISPNGGMPNADMMVGWVDDTDDTVSITDRMSTAKAEPPLDTQQDWVKVAGERNSTHTTLEFTRPWDTKDAQDIAFTAGAMRIIWALGNSDTLSYHSSRGQASVVFWGQTLTPPVGTNKLLVRMTTSNPVPASVTTYMCQGLELPHDQTYQSVYYKPLISNRDIVHHMIVYVCDSPVDKTAAECNGMKKGCNGIMYAWAVGGPDMSFPPDAGYVFSQHALLEIHYDNQKQTSGIMDDSGVEIYYIGAPLRPNNVGVFKVGAPIPSIKIPAKKKAYQITRRCDLPGKNSDSPGVTVFSAAVHMHQYGTQMWSVLYRNGNYKATLARNLAWDFNVQEFKNVDPTVNVKAGDTIVTTCVWDTSMSATPVDGGDASEDEMCLSIMFYYPKVGSDECYGKLMSSGSVNSQYPWDANSVRISPHASGVSETNVGVALTILSLLYCLLQ